jgi:hypoxanthine phosphoribosyltransferase
MPANVTLDKMTFKKMIDSKSLDKKVKELAEEINEEYKGKFLYLIVVLKGAFVFAADLVRNLTVDHSVHFVRFSSYEGMESQNIIKEKISLNFNVEGKHLLIVEDIIDSGNTLNYFVSKLQKNEPLSLNIATLLFKPNAFKYNFPIKFKAFNIKNEFVIGYGLDLDEKARHLKHIYQLFE